MLRSLIAATLLVAPLAASAQEAPDLTPAQQFLHDRVAYLASDELRGREAGTPDFDRAADYVVSQMESIGLEPGGTQGWFQPVPLITFSPGETSVSFTRGNRKTELESGAEVLGLASAVDEERSVSGKMVFVGFGIDDSEAGIDDYEGLDVEGKVVAMLFGVPKDAPEEVGQRWGGLADKVETAMAHGASAVVIIESGQLRARLPFSVVSQYISRGRTTLDLGAEAAGAEPLAMLSQEAATKLFAGSGIEFADVLEAEMAGKPVPHGALGVTLAAHVTTTMNRFTSKNVIGKLKGSDPELAGQYLVVSAHLDHVGVGSPNDEGDTIYNGAMDNAIGVATVLSMAKRFTEAGEAPRRSILFVALTAEEKGLLGSRYMADHWPVGDGEMLVGDLNFDMPILTFPLTHIVALGEEHSSLGPAVHIAAEEVGMGVIPDPFPEENFFVRSDHYSFVTAGIPAISIDSGPSPDGTGTDAIQHFLKNDYHKPSDEIGLINWESAAKFALLSYTFVRNVANADERPAWNPGNEYGVRYDGYGADREPEGEAETAE
ncbi:M20/M25/M40 family metallo-hydrolase [Stakelama tenebrarum]|uniref:M20/M25/M40 family metallo-hydrolase n=1 Tax=Stakelama tenebrarum TaxID=2711215 RepID=A0A6G6Y9Y0_9SPHN|nr:M20/M25/M40 family metallo-hydrolase [Sphingosinithalassobacter tenebrarum]QIG81651.1 M20/M25/M40 family metallo-hydrolase [Sphingosinithalassobacter tenebrarum]